MISSRVLFYLPTGLSFSTPLMSVAMSAIPLAILQTLPRKSIPRCRDDGDTTQSFTSRLASLWSAEADMSLAKNMKQC